MHRSSIIRGAVGVVFALVAAACAGTLEHPEEFAQDELTGTPDAGVATSCDDVPQVILRAQCATAGCHDATTHLQGLDLGSPDVYARLAGTAAQSGAGALVDPGGDPTRSVLYQRLAAGTMPPSGRLAADRLGCVSRWIAEGGEISSDPAGTADR